MASIEYILNRIDGKKAELNKLNKDLERLNDRDPYCWGDKWFCETKRQIELVTASIDYYENQLAIAIENQNIKSIPVINDFLDTWEKKMVAFCLAEKPKFDEARKRFTVAHIDSHAKWHDATMRGESVGTCQNIYTECLKKEKSIEQSFSRKWAHVIQFIHGDNSYEDNVVKDVAEEKKRKYGRIISEIISAVGQITDAGNLTIGMNGELNGFVVGDKGRASVRTIDAGGYNIQCYHFRTLIRKVG